MKYYYATGNRKSAPAKKLVFSILFLTAFMSATLIQSSINIVSAAIRPTMPTGVTPIPAVTAPRGPITIEEARKICNVQAQLNQATNNPGFIGRYDFGSNCVESLILQYGLMETTVKPNPTIVYEALEDATIMSNRPSRNTGKWRKMHVDGRPDIATLIRFDQSLIAGEHPGGVKSAKLRLFIERGDSRNVSIHTVSNGFDTWQENTITWENSTTLRSYLTHSTKVEKAVKGEFVVVDVTDIVKAGGADSIYISGLNKKHVTFATSESSNPSNRPTLTVR